MISVRPAWQEVKRCLGSRNLRPRVEARPTGRAGSKEQLGDWDAQTHVSDPCPAKACHTAKWRVGYSPRCYMLGRECPQAVLPDRALYLPTFSHLLIVNKLLSRSLARSHIPVPPLATPVVCGSPCHKLALVREIG